MKEWQQGHHQKFTHLSLFTSPQTRHCNHKRHKTTTDPNRTDPTSPTKPESRIALILFLPHPSETKKNKTDKRTQDPPIPAKPCVRFSCSLGGINRCSLHEQAELTSSSSTRDFREEDAEEGAEWKKERRGGGGSRSSVRERRGEGSRVTGKTVRGRFRIPSSPTANKGSLLRPLSQAYNLKQAVKASIRMLVFHSRAGAGPRNGSDGIRVSCGYVPSRGYADRFYAPVASQLWAQVVDKRFFARDKSHGWSILLCSVNRFDSVIPNRTNGMASVCGVFFSFHFGEKSFSIFL